MNDIKKIQDEMDVRIAQFLAHNGRASNREIARRLGVSEGSIRQRLRRLTASGALRIAAQVSPDAAPEAFMAIVGLKIDGRQLEACAQRIRQLPPVLETMIVTGRHDLMAVVLASSRQTLVDFVTRDLAAIPGIRDSETNVVLHSYGQWLDPARVWPEAATQKKTPEEDR